MPEAFERCRANGGKIRTKKLSGNRYMRICYHNGKSYPGEVHHKKGSDSTARSAAAKKLTSMAGK